ncbi:hypothetical protein OCEANICA350_20105 [Oceanicaulis sp. 350]|nr:hypothetical protein OCEANICA350_20105 [Oceanicaulis sp. 350]
MQLAAITLAEIDAGAFSLNYMAGVDHFFLCAIRIRPPFGALRGFSQGLTSFDSFKPQ